MMATYTLTKIKTFIGMEGYGLNATICRDGRAAAFAMDDGNGGSMHIDFRNPSQSAKSFQSTTNATAEAEEASAQAFALDWLTTSPDAEESRQMAKQY